MRSFIRHRLLALACALATTAQVAAQTAVSEVQAKVGFVLNFARYIEWPERVFAARNAPILLCVLGRDEVATALTALEGRQVQGRPIAVHRLTNPDEARQCQVLFIAESEARRLALTLRAVVGQPVLTVSDIDAFIDAGGAIGIVRGDGRLQFEVNRAVLDQAQLKASSNMLKLARNLAEAKGRN
ncbi:MAG: YfiR family protein [Candidatus Accumulibacter phosphatis]|nr:YfiR family protein [Candidatus Accumulibacter phosphatis]